MDRDSSNPGSRFRWAIKQSGRTLEDIADAIGCTHATLSLWQTGKTNVHNIKAGLLLAFARQTGASLEWLLTGDGPRLSGYPQPRRDAPLIAMARHIVADLPPNTVATAERLLAALEPPPPNYLP